MPVPRTADTAGIRLRTPPPEDLDSWSQVLGELAAGRDAVWMDDGRNPEIRFEWSGQDGVAVNGCIVFVPLGPRRLWKPPPAPTSGGTSRSSLLKAIQPQGRSFRWESRLAHQALDRAVGRRLAPGKVTAP
ncbi:DUF5959 family protein [Streptomyces antibioticus]|uniref:DUF5959 family protein n=1 Tax=Streptomyces antibioticus TaxID=1890 RepID=UPI00371DA1F3